MLHGQSSVPLRISLIGPVYPYRGGIAHYTTMLAKAILHKHDVQVISFKKQYPGWLYPGKANKEPLYDPSKKIEAEYILDPLNPLSWWKTTKRINMLKPDMIIFQWWTTFWAPAFSFIGILLHHLNKTYIVHNVLPHEERKFDRILTRMALRQGDHFITHSLNEKRRLIQMFPNAQVTTCYFPIYENFEHLNISQENARKDLDLPMNRKVLLFFGFVRPYKGLELLLQALAKMRDQGENIFLVVAGEIWEDESIYYKLIAEYNLEEHVKLDNRYIPDNEVPLYFSAADLFVAPYSTGTQSASVATALWFGLPIVATEIAAAGISPEQRQFVQVIKRQNVDDLIKAIGDVGKYPNMRTHYGCHLETGWQDLVSIIEKYSLA